MKKILLIVPTCLLQYQKAIVEELLSNTSFDYYYLIQEAKLPKILKLNPLIAGIDKRFLRSRISAFDCVDAQAFFTSKPMLKSHPLELEETFHFVINLSDSITELEKIKFEKVIKPCLAIADWDNAVVDHHTYTTIAIQASEDNIDWKVIDKLSFCTRKGIYNNRDTALFYFSFLLSSFIRGQVYASEISEFKSFSPFKLSRYYFGLLSIIIRRKASNTLFSKNWKVAIIKDKEVTYLDQPKKTFWADPFLFKYKNQNWIFFEELIGMRSLGQIAAVRVEGAKIVEKHRVLHQKFHLSFPSVFEREGEIFMMAEQSESNMLSIYKAKKFPLEWELHTTIIENMKVIDPSWVFYENRYWLFFNKIENFEFENNERLYIYYSDDLFSKNWQPHAQNPVLIDIQKARNAGQLYFNDGALMRPSQNCRGSYGSEVLLNKITELTPTTYQEETVSSLKGYNSSIGMHTVNFLEDLAVTDFLVKE